MFWNKKPLIVTHSSHFHPDDVCAVAVLHIMLRGKYKLIRTRNMDIARTADYLVDFGGEHDPAKKRFDHHQQGGAGVRANGSPYASFGLVWKEYGERLCGKKSVAESIDEDIVAPADTTDNGVEFPLSIYGVKPHLFGDFVHAFNPVWDEDEKSRDDRFKTAVRYAVVMLERAIEREKRKEEGKNLAEKIYEASADKKIIVFEREYPWRKVLTSHPEPLFAVFPNLQDKTWSAKAVPLGEGFKNRTSFPKEWAGKRDADLAAVSGVADAVFCHNALFLAVAKSKEGAVELAKKAIGA